jgi:hypothetical protein
VGETWLGGFGALIDDRVFVCRHSDVCSYGGNLRGRHADHLSDRFSRQPLAKMLYDFLALRFRYFWRHAISPQRAIRWPQVAFLFLRSDPQ